MFRSTYKERAGRTREPAGGRGWLRCRRAGMSLLELLICIAIIALLASMLLFAVVGLIAKIRSLGAPK